MVTFERKGTKGLHPGLDLGDKVVDLAVGLKSKGLELPVPFTMKTFLEMGVAAMTAARTLVAEGTGSSILPRGEVVFKAPIFDAGKVICVGMNYVDHCTEQNIPVPEEPIIFNKFPSTICSNGDPIIYEDGQTKELDFEVEMVIVIGTKGRAISKEDAMKHVVGFTVAHDVSARDWQLKRNGGQWLLGKTFDCYSPIGPAIVTTDELGDPHNLGIRCFLNGKEVQNSNTNQMVFKTEHCVEWISRYITLLPGDIILTGTPPGVGCFRKPQLFLKDGDVVRCEIDGIGAIENPIKKIVVPRPHL